MGTAVRARAANEQVKFVEMFGLPGVGKSTLTTGLAELASRNAGRLFCFEKAHLQSQQLGYSCTGFPAANIRLMTSHFAWMVFVIRSYTQTRCPFYRAIKRIKWTFDALTTFSRCKSDDSESRIVIRDEGFCCRAFSLALSRDGDTKGLEDYFYRMPAPDGVIILRASISTVEKRVEIRARSNGSHVDNRILNYQPYVRLIDCAERVLRERNIPVVTICTEPTVDEQLATVEMFLYRILHT